LLVILENTFAMQGSMNVKYSLIHLNIDKWDSQSEMLQLGL